MSHGKHDWAAEEPASTKRQRASGEQGAAASVHAAYLQQLEYPVAKRAGGVVNESASQSPADALDAGRSSHSVKRQAASMRWSFFTLWFLGLMFATLLSAVLLVYTKDLSRRLFIQYGALRQQQQTLRLNWGRLLLEDATLSTPAAFNKLLVSSWEW